jgi:hypothetical protein
MSLRGRAVAKMLSRTKGLFARCHWCNRELVWWQRLPHGAIKSEIRDGNPGQIVSFQYFGELRRMHIVTIDHVLEISKGGRNDSDNLVLSCWTCNGHRSALPKQNIYRACVQCGEAKRSKKGKPAGRRRCGECCYQNKIRILGISQTSAERATATSSDQDHPYA